MTEYQIKRQFLSKINARTRAIAKKYGVDRNLIAEQAIDGLDGVFVDTKYGTINITKGFESEELYKVLEKNVLTATDAEAKAMEKYKDFIGPLPKNAAAKEVKAMYEYKSGIEEIVKNYYDLEANIKMSPWNKPEGFDEFEKKLSDIGKQWRDDAVPYSKLNNLLEDVKIMRDAVNKHF